MLELEEEDKSKPLDDWDSLNCSECDSELGFIPPEIEFLGKDQMALYCHQCATHLAVDDN